jgi:hypothetical protein
LIGPSVSGCGVKLLFFFSLSFMYFTWFGLLLFGEISSEAVRGSKRL